jgi:ComEC/Rec2-related protein
MAGETKTEIADERLLFSRDFDAPLLLPDTMPLEPSNRLPVPSSKPRSRVSLWHISRWPAQIAGYIEIEQARGALFHFVPVFLGAGAALYFVAAEEPFLTALAAVLALFALGIFMAKDRPVLRALMMAGALTAAGETAAKLETLRVQTILLGENISTRVTGRILSIEKVGRGYRAIVEILATERPKLKFQPERMKITLRKAPFGLKAGDGIKALFLLRPPTGPVRPGSFDFAFDAYFDRIGANGISLSEVEGAEIPETGIVSRIEFWFEQQRTKIAERMRRQIPGQDGEMAAALVTGLTGGIDNDTNEAMRVSGLAHVTSISGLHMALVAGAVMGIVRLLLAAFPLFSSRFPAKKIAALLAFFAAFVYLLLSGGGVATLRSFIMLGVMLAAALFDRAALTMRNLVIAAIIILVWTPHEVIGPSFQMSFAATAALIGAYQIFSERRAKRLETRTPDARLWARAVRLGWTFLIGFALTSLIAGVATSVYSAYHFNRVAPLGLFANLAAMPAISLVVMPMALLSVLLMPFGLDGLPLYLMGKGVGIMLAVADHFSAMSAAGATGLMPGGALLAFTIALALASLCVSRLKLAAVPFVVLGVALILGRTVPDAVISEDAKLIGVRGEGGSLAVNRERPNRFTVQNWQRAYLAGSLSLPSNVPSGVQSFECSEGYCVLQRPDGLRIAQVEDRDILPAACADADLVVAAFPVPKRGCGEGGATLISARELARRGAAEVFVSKAPGEGKQAIQVSFAFESLDRPWHRHRAFSRAARNMAPYKTKPKPVPAAKP